MLAALLLDIIAQIGVLKGYETGFCGSTPFGLDGGR
tara:strand:+ start:1769 stop:1876 length:108 start_codon:yes stop_codon:yes gene_type:complete